MACPDCGGNDRSPLAPGFWRCDSLVTYYETVMAPAPGAPPHLGLLAPVTYPRQRVCAKQYHERSQQEDADMQYCACDTGAIGRCSRDHRPVCGFHSQLRDGKRLCNECVAEHDAAQARAAARAELEAAEAAARPELDKVRAAAAAARGLPDPASQALLLQLLEQGARRHLAGPRYACISKSVGEAITEACRPEVPFTAAQMVANFVSKGLLARHAATLLTLTSWERGAFGGMKRRKHGRIDGWLTQRGSSGTSGTYGTEGTPDVYVLADGRLASTAHNSTDIGAGAQHDPAQLEHLWQLARSGHLRIPGLSATVSDKLHPFTGQLGK